MTNPIQLVVFDMIGTTVRDRGEAPGAFLATLAEFGIHATVEEIANVRGASKIDSLRALFPKIREGDVPLAYERFRTLVRQEFALTAAAVAGADSVFKLLREDGVHVALNSGLDRASVSAILNCLVWPREWFAAVICSDDVSYGRPAPDMIRAAMAAVCVRDPLRVANVGDTTLDLLAGAAAAVRFNVGVYSGAHTRDQLVQAPHTHVIASISELPRLLTEATAGDRQPSP